MKKYIICLILAACFSLSAFSQDITTTDLKRFEVAQDTKVPFRLYPTSNMWNFLKLDTRTGQIWGVQFSTKSIYKAGTWEVDATKIEEPVPENIGRFTLYPTSNFYTFILLDQFDGRTWQVQFDLDKTDNNIRFRIY